MVNFYLWSLFMDKPSSFKATGQKRFLILHIWELFRIWKGYVHVNAYPHKSGCRKTLIFVTF